MVPPGSFKGSGSGCGAGGGVPGGGRRVRGAGPARPGRCLLLLFLRRPGVCEAGPGGPVGAGRGSGSRAETSLFLRAELLGNTPSLARPLMLHHQSYACPAPKKRQPPLTLRFQPLEESRRELPPAAARCLTPGRAVTRHRQGLASCPGRGGN